MKDDDVPTQLDDHETVNLRKDPPDQDPPDQVPPDQVPPDQDPPDQDPADQVPADAVPAEDGGAVPEGAGRARRVLPWVRHHLIAVVAVVVLLALAAGLVLSTLALRREHALDDARASALTAGRDSAVALSSYDYRTLDKDFGAVTSRSTPAFRDSFAQTSASLQKVLQQYDATARSTVVAAGVTSATTKRAVVLVFLNQVATNTNQKAGPTTDQSRVEVTLARSGNRWLIDGVKLL